MKISAYFTLFFVSSAIFGKIAEDTGANSPDKAKTIFCAPTKTAISLLVAKIVSIKAGRLL